MSCPSDLAQLVPKLIVPTYFTQYSLTTATQPPIITFLRFMLWPVKEPAFTRALERITIVTSLVQSAIWLLLFLQVITASFMRRELEQGLETMSR